MTWGASVFGVMVTIAELVSRVLLNGHLTTDGGRCGTEQLPSQWVCYRPASPKNTQIFTLTRLDCWEVHCHSRSLLLLLSEKINQWCLIHQSGMIFSTLSQAAALAKEAPPGRFLLCSLDLQVAHVHVYKYTQQRSQDVLNGSVCNRGLNPVPTSCCPNQVRACMEPHWLFLGLPVDIKKEKYLPIAASTNTLGESHRWQVISSTMKTTGKEEAKLACY